MSLTETPPLPSTDWDVLIAGTGITQSLLAVALSRAGKTVLQIDRNSYYGSASAAFYTLPELEAWAARVNAGLEPGFSNATVTCAAGELGRGHTLSLAPDIVYWDSALLRLLRAADMADSFSWQAVGSWWVWLTDEDVAVPAPAGGGALLAGARVKAAKAVAAGRKKWNKGRKRPAAAAGEPAGEEEEESAPAEGSAPPPPLPLPEGGATALRRVGAFREVACTFEDVAWSADLSDRDRSHLGEFLRFVMKHDSDDPSDHKHRTRFTENRSTSLETFLSTTFPLPPSAVTSLSSLTLLPTAPAATPLALALPALARHLRSLGHIPDARSAAALTIAYGGSSELCQVLSRAAAVAGGTTVLSRGVAAAAVHTSPTRRAHAVTLTSGETVHADHLIGTRSDLLLRPPVPATAPQTTQRLSRAAYVLSGALPPALFARKHADEAVAPAAAVAVVPAPDGTPVYLLARSSVTGECPRGRSLLYASTAQPHDAITAAVERLLCAQPEKPTVVASLLYTVCAGADAAGTADADAAADGVVCVGPGEPGLAFDDALVAGARARFGGIVGVGAEEGEGRFMRLPEQARRMLEEMEEA